MCQSARQGGQAWPGTPVWLSRRLNGLNGSNSGLFRRRREAKPGMWQAREVPRQGGPGGPKQAQGGPNMANTRYTHHPPCGVPRYGTMYHHPAPPVMAGAACNDTWQRVRMTVRGRVGLMRHGGYLRTKVINLRPKVN